MTMEAFENTIATAYGMGGSTNMYLHLLAIAREAGVPLTIERIQAVGERVPLIANLQPHGPYAMVTLHALGGVRVVMKELLDHGLLHGGALTVTGRTVARTCGTCRRSPIGARRTSSSRSIGRSQRREITSACSRATWRRRAPCSS